MKKIIMAIFVFVSLFLLVGCSNANQKFVDKVQAEIDAGEDYSVEDAREDLRKECLEALVRGTGFVLAVEGCESKAEIQAKLDAGEEVYGVVITFADGDAVSAVYKEIGYTDLLLIK